MADATGALSLFLVVFDPTARGGGGRDAARLEIRSHPNLTRAKLSGAHAFTKASRVKLGGFIALALVSYLLIIISLEYWTIIYIVL